MSIPIVDMLDFTGQNPNIPAIVASKPKKVAGYMTGSFGIEWPLQVWDMFPKDQVGKVRIDQSPGLHKFAQGAADVADVETNAGTITNFVAAAKQRIGMGLHCDIYIQSSSVNAAHTRFQKEGILSHVRWWVADWNLSRDEAMSRIMNSDSVVAVQYASPSSNPHSVIPGTSMTLAATNVDLSVARADWYAPTSAPKPPQKLELSVTPISVVIDGGWTAVDEADHYVIVDQQGKVLARTTDNHIKALAITPREAVIVHAIVHSKPVLVGTWEMK